jgi:hypothetical protein
MSAYLVVARAYSAMPMTGEAGISAAAILMFDLASAKSSGVGVALLAAVNASVTPSAAWERLFAQVAAKSSQ